jgi:hypothetical protein
MINAFVYVVESPSDFDLLDGRTEGAALCEVLRLASVPFAYSLATTRAALDEALTNRLYGEIERYSRWPIIHFSAHGNQEGIGLTDGHDVSWADLHFLMRDLKNGMNGGLLTCLSACYGIAAAKMDLRTDKDSPLFATVGHSGSPSWSTSAVAFMAFYHQLFLGAELEGCVQAMQVASGDFGFQILSGKQVKDDWTRSVRQQQAKRLLDTLRRSRPGSKN